ncbi:hypothetical protein SEA_FORZA_56 [Gordonia phage Forza]|uniref:Uncharacterized protein n=1 Tax=Gordonia phage Forza TaxID=2571247 RepID=A0A650EYZ6_9CAUD|nr:hypothetical protein PP303_gp056 [Gordonia phage Forza]QEM41526.1 hypothetical protein SEA_BOOPY_57 [Gordonia phage Boopy]QGT55049.1 hypothetical protein SEA_FORZA_56 [Gordonia phage Forza]UXE04199.1 hypothetical protein SEA_BLUENGOLD_55 [Gordonia phage BlueNGold]WBF03838.1 hypothetical protein SEA_MAREELIH_55 [Gordonia phage Mareelih]
MKEDYAYEFTVFVGTDEGVWKRAATEDGPAPIYGSFDQAYAWLDRNRGWYRAHLPLTVMSRRVTKWHRTGQSVT